MPAACADGRRRTRLICGPCSAAVGFVGYRFRRQVPIGPYIADFVCYGRRLIIELDGSQHADNPRDEVRDAELRARGFRVLRIWNGDVVQDEPAVLEGILVALQESTGLD